MVAPITVTEQLLQQVVDRLDAINTKLEQPAATTASGFAPGGNVTPKPGPPAGKKKPSQRANRPVDGL